MIYKFEFRPYQRKFARSLVTSHGIWDIREGIILSLTDVTGRVSWGEIAPISWFGSESIEQALLFCQQLPSEITDEIIFSIPDSLSACQFGFESAWEELERWGAGSRLAVSVAEREQGARENSFPLCPLHPAPLPLVPNAPYLTYSALLPSGEAVLDQWETLYQQGYRTFKWKIGVDAIANELKIFESLTQALPTSSKLRLDANGGLSYEEANLWLGTCDHLKTSQELPIEIEFIEQPLPVEQFQEMLELNACYQTAIALDESVATLQQLESCFLQGWRGIFVIKPGIVGSPSRLRQFCHRYKIDAVFSSVFETAIARQAALQLAATLSQKNRAVGFGINHFFQEEETWLQSLWNNL